MALQLGITGNANPHGYSKYRHWLSRTWDPRGPVALVIGINPNTATESEDDRMTTFLIELLQNLDGQYSCGGYILVNCCDYRDRYPMNLKNQDEPCSAVNMNTIRTMLDRCDFVIASWGTTNYGNPVEVRRSEVAELVREGGKRAICFSPNRKPIYCSRTSANSGDGRWSNTPVPWP